MQAKAASGQVWLTLCPPRDPSCPGQGPGSRGRQRSHPVSPEMEPKWVFKNKTSGYNSLRFLTPKSQAICIRPYQNQFNILAMILHSEDESVQNTTVTLSELSVVGERVGRLSHSVYSSASYHRPQGDFISIWSEKEKPLWVFQTRRDLSEVV